MNNLPRLVIYIINITLGISGAIGLIWLLIGGPMAIITLSKNRQNKGFNRKRWLWIGLGGFLVLAVVIFFYAILFLLRALGPIEYASY